MQQRPCSSRELLVLESTGLVGLNAESATAFFFIGLIIALAPMNMPFAFEGQNVRGDAVQKPAVVADHHHAADEIEDFRKILPYFEEFGLSSMVNAFPYRLEDMRPLFDLAEDANACLMNIIGGVMPVDPTDAVPVINRWMQEAEAYDFPLLFETHRDSLLNDLYYTLQVMDLVPDMRLTTI